MNVKNSSVSNYPVKSTKLNDSKFCYSSLTIQLNINYLHTFKCQTVLLQIIQFSMSTQFISIWSIVRTLSGATTPGQSGPGSDGNKGVFRITQSSSITIRLLRVISRHSLVGGSYFAALIRSVYSTASTDRATVSFSCVLCQKTKITVSSD